MKHASAEAVRKLEPLLALVRRIDALSERKPGTFYWRSSAFLHFHEDASGLFADVKLNGMCFERMPVSTERQRQDFMEAVRNCFSGSSHA